MPEYSIVNYWYSSCCEHISIEYSHEKWANGTDYWTMLAVSRANYSVAESDLRVSLAQARSEQGVLFQDPLKQEVSRGGPRDGFMPCPGTTRLAADGCAGK